VTGDKPRLDEELVVRGLAPSRARARDAILRGTVTVDGVRVNKPGKRVSIENTITMADQASGYVSRAALKLKHALDMFLIDVGGRTALDIGASTGGFTQLLLERGAKRVYAVDAGSDQLHETLKREPRVIDMSQTNARGLSRRMFADEIGLITADISFVSLIKVLGPALELAKPGAHLIALIKPQFELEPGDISKGGIVRDAGKLRRACEQVLLWLDEQPGWQVMGIEPSPIEGAGGNREFLTAAVKSREAA
jgi:23S rRNA (cytidine1920-2'-O)/16S rRNA (cytidine1409-2'-O)-methyltransferase